MRTLGISIARLEAGEVELAMAYSPTSPSRTALSMPADHAVRHRLRHRGVHADAGGLDILTVEFKTNLLAPASGERFTSAPRGQAGRTLTICEARPSRSATAPSTGRDHDRHADGADNATEASSQRRD